MIINMRTVQRSDKISREVIMYLYLHVENACNNSQCKFPGVWNHIINVIRYAKALARKFKADEDVCEIAALFHDYSGILNYEYYNQHHVHSAEIASQILKRLNFPDSKIINIQHCILSHRGSRNIERKTIEAKILATADSLAHIEDAHALLKLAEESYEMEHSEAIKWVLAKLQRSFNKIMPELQDAVKPRFDYAIKKLILN